jgi:hypothetical protein
MNITDTIAPKSDQLNADDLICGPKTITITAVKIAMGEQPVSVHYDGDDGKPYKPGKSMRRVMVSIWGNDSSKYAGRSLTLYRDESVQFGGQQVGGIRISHASHIERPVTLALTTTRARRSAFTVQPLKMPKEQDLAEIVHAMEGAAVNGPGALKTAWDNLSATDKRRIKPEMDALKEIARLAEVNDRLPVIG